MSLFKSKTLAEAQDRNARLEALLTAANFDAQALLAKDDPQALATAIDAREAKAIEDAQAAQAEAHTAALGKLQGELDEAREQLAAAETEATDTIAHDSAFAQVMAELKIFPSAQAAATADAKALRAALEARISTRAGERLATHGLTRADAPEQDVKADATQAPKPASPQLTGRERLMATIKVRTLRDRAA